MVPELPYPDILHGNFSSDQTTEPFVATLCHKLARRTTLFQPRGQKFLPPVRVFSGRDVLQEVTKTGETRPRMRDFIFGVEYR